MPVRIAALFALAALIAPQAAAREYDGRQPVQAAEEAGMQLAQRREVQIFIDQYGREVLVDAWTGEVIGVVPPRERGPSPYERRVEREYELRGDPGTRREPLGERLSRELEIMLGHREPPPRGFDPEFRPRPMPDRRDAFPQPPRQEDRGLGRPDQPRSVERAPLGAPRPDDAQRPPAGGELAAIPQQPPEILEPAQPLGGTAITPSLPAGVSKEVANIQVLLDRLGLSPGVIDGRMGDNVNKALSAYREMRGQGLRTYDPISIEEALAETGGPAFMDYTITPADAATNLVASIPEDYGEKARMEHMGFTSVEEMLAERFHMDERYLKALNPDADFRRPGTVIHVTNVGAPLKAEVARIVADKGAKQVRAYDASGRLVAAYPATIGSEATPSPTGTVTVERIALDPEYTYNPRINFQQGDNTRVLTIPPGPNGPVGTVWIALSKPTYGIHGTPEPSRIGRTYSNGCIRLTNWDAQELAKMVKPGVTVQFVE